MIARTVMTVGLALGVLSYGLVLLPIDLGVTPRFEPVVIAVHLAGAITALGLAVALWSGSDAAARALRHPLVLISGFVALWSALVAPFADFPWRALVGIPQVGQGPVMKADFAVFLAAALSLRGDRRARDMLIVLAVAVSWLANVLPDILKSLVGSTPGHISYYVFAVAALVASRIGGHRGAVAGLIAVTPILALGTNKSAVVAMLVFAIPAYLFCTLRPKHVRRTGVALAVAIPLATIAVDPLSRADLRRDRPRPRGPSLRVAGRTWLGIQRRIVVPLSCDDACFSGGYPLGCDL
jgi:hypothetical protein